MYPEHTFSLQTKETMLRLNPKTVGNIFCVGRNYAKHAKELNNPIPQEPVIFTKASTTICALSGDIHLPQHLGRVDHELEIVVRLGQDLYQASPEQARDAISHIGLGLDLTLREKQSELKAQSYPWDLAKSFVNACPLTEMLPLDASNQLNNIDFSMTVQDKVQQQGNSQDMLFDIVSLLVFISSKIPMQASDLVMTGTPEGVGPLNHDDKVAVFLAQQCLGEAHISRNG